MQKVWLLTSFPLMFALLFIPANYYWLSFLIFWWLHPLFERPLLMILSLGVFGNTPSTSEVLKASPRLIIQRFFSSLTIRRLNFYRSMDLAVIQLENLRGYQYSERVRILHRIDSAPATWTTLIGWCIYWVLLFSLLLFLSMLVPENVQYQMENVEWWESSTIRLIVIALFYLSIGAVAPFYVACGFSLYLNRRVKLEGWDIEIAFKKMMQKRSLTSPPLIVLLISSIALSSLLTSDPAQAQSDTKDSSLGSLFEEERQNAKSDIKQILNGELFNQEKTVRRLQWKDPKEGIKEEKEHNWLDSFWKKFEPLGESLQPITDFFSQLPKLLEMIFWVLVIALVIFVLSFYKRWIKAFSNLINTDKKAFRPESMFGMDVTEESLPEDISQTAWSLWQQGDYRESIALLYRGSLARLLDMGVPFKEGSTELECLNLTKGHLNASKSSHSIHYFSELTDIWSLLAYAHQTPSTEIAQKLCEDWNPCWIEGAQHG